VLSKSKLDRNSSHLSGEYFVAAELYRRGLSVAMTLGNAKAIDLFAERGSRTVNVQVKTIANKKNVGWPITKKNIRKNIIYVFVCLNVPTKTPYRYEPPDYFICTSKEARSKVKEYSTRSIINLSKIQQFRGQWGKIVAALKPITNQQLFGP
jgi:hypothetical protein